MAGTKLEWCFAPQGQRRQFYTLSDVAIQCHPHQTFTGVVRRPFARKALCIHAGGSQRGLLPPIHSSFATDQFNLHDGRGLSFLHLARQQARAWRDCGSCSRVLEWIDETPNDMAYFRSRL
eukprot:1988769-Pleurochrysis_carterae.AAC.1